MTLLNKGCYWMICCLLGQNCCPMVVTRRHWPRLSCCSKRRCWKTMRRHCWSFLLRRSLCRHWEKTHWAEPYQVRRHHHCSRPRGRRHCQHPWWILFRSYCLSLDDFRSHCWCSHQNSGCHFGSERESFDGWNSGSELTESWSFVSCLRSYWVGIWTNCYLMTGSKVRAR